MFYNWANTSKPSSPTKELYTHKQLANESKAIQLNTRVSKGFVKETCILLSELRQRVRDPMSHYGEWIFENTLSQMDPLSYYEGIKDAHVPR